MSQASLTIANQGFAAFRSALNNALGALGSMHKGSSAPAGILTGQEWLNDSVPTATKWLRNLYDGAASIKVGNVDTTNDRFIPWAGVGARVVAKTSAYTINTTAGTDERGEYHSCSTASFAVTVPAGGGTAGGVAIEGGWSILVGNDSTTATHVATLTRSGSDVFNNGLTTIALSCGDRALLISNGSTAWTVIVWKEPYAFRAHKNGSAQGSIVTATNTKITFTTEALDLGGWYDAANSRWQPPAGKYGLACSLYWDSVLADQVRVLTRLYEDAGTTEVGRGQHVSSGTDDQAVLAVAEVETDGSKQFQAYGQHHTGANEQVNGSAIVTYFQGWRIA